MKNTTRLTFVVTLLIFVLALVPRVVPREYGTIDEFAHWVGRSESFLEALQSGNLADTAQTFHPGVITMWAGSGGILIDHALNGPDYADENPTRYAYNIRIVASLINALAVTAAFPILQRLFSRHIALLTALLWAFSPFVIENSAMLHVDGLSMSFMMLSFLAGMVALHFDESGYEYDANNQVRWKWLLTSGFLGGMASLTKFTTLVVGGILALLMLIINWRHLRLRLFPRQIAPFIMWGIAAGGAWLVLYPAVWVAPERVIASFTIGVEIAFSGHYNFFMGEITANPSLLYYPVAFALRVTPWVLIGLVLAPFALSRRYHSRYSKQVMGVFLYVVLFLATMIIQPKQFDRYLIPIFPAVYVYASFGLLWAFDQIATLVRKTTDSLRLLVAAWGSIIVILAGFWLLQHPYLRAYYNPLLGGISTAKETILVGYGEGLQQAAKWIKRDTENICDVNVVSGYEKLVEQELSCTNVTKMALWPDDIRQADYVIFYFSHQQRRMFDYLSSSFEPFEPAHVVSINGTDFA